MAAAWTVTEKPDGSKEVVWSSKGEVKSCGTVPSDTPIGMCELWVMLNSQPGDILWICGRLHFKMAPGAWA